MGPALAETIFDAGLRRATIQHDEAAYEQTVANYRETVLAAFQQVEDNLSALRILSQQIGQPVRVQWMRDEGIAWDPKGPPHLTTMRAGIDSSGRVVAWDYNGRMLSGRQR